jgi:AcrR family transcriptional regulator
MTPQARSTITRKRILQAAAELIDERADTRASIAAVASRAGVTTGAFYFHFTSREDLDRALLDVFRDARRRTLELALRADLSPVEAAMVNSARLASTLVGDVVVRAGLRLTIDGGRSIAGAAAPWRVWRRQLDRTLELARRDGALATPLALEDLSRAFIATMLGIVCIVDLDRTWSTVPEGVRRAWLLLVEACASPEWRARLTDRAMQHPPGR